MANDACKFPAVSPSFLTPEKDIHMYQKVHPPLIAAPSSNRHFNATNAN